MSCYRKSNSTVISDTSSIDGACSPSELVSPCCPDNSGSLCLSDYLCLWYGLGATGGDAAGATGFVMASCTDATYESGMCVEHCTDNPVPDVIYNPDTGLWACCGWSYTTGTDCANPTNETFVAPAPSLLLAAASISSSITGTATSSTASSTTTPSSSSSSTLTSAAIPRLTSTASFSASSSYSSSSASASSSASSVSGLSSGTKAGIAIGVVLGVLLLALAFFFTWRLGSKSRQRHSPHSKHAILSPTRRQELEEGDSQEAKYRDYKMPAMELHSNSTSELPAAAPMQQHERNRLIELQ